MPDVGQYLIGQPTVAEQVMRALGLKGDLPQRVDGLFALGLTVDDFTRPEYAWLRRESLYEQGANIAAVAAQFSNAYLTITGQRALAVVEQIIIVNLDAAATRNFRFAVRSVTAFPYAVTGTGSSRDDRATGPANSIARFGSGTSAARQVNGGPFVSVPSLGTLIVPVSIILTGATDNTGAQGALCVETDIVNVPCMIGWIWRERSIMDSEL